jgi:hypothetical protein
MVPVLAVSSCMRGCVCRAEVQAGLTLILHVVQECFAYPLVNVVSNGCSMRAMRWGEAMPTNPWSYIQAMVRVRSLTTMQNPPKMAPAWCETKHQTAHRVDPDFSQPRLHWRRVGRTQAWQVGQKMAAGLIFQPSRPLYSPTLDPDRASRIAMTATRGRNVH